MNIIKNIMKNKIILAVIIGLVALLSLVHIPKTNINPNPSLHIDKVVHIIMYFSIVFFAMKVFPTKIYLVIIVSISYGIMMEVLQGFTGFRSMDFYDVVANSVGAILGAYFGRKKLHSK